LAYVQHFGLRGRDPDTNMHILEREDNFEAIETHQIIRDVHLIPFFGTRNCAREAVKDGINEFDKYLLNTYSDKYIFFKFACN
jgi:hypothetical protein